MRIRKFNENENFNLELSKINDIQSEYIKYRNNYNKLLLELETIVKIAYKDMIDTYGQDNDMGLIELDDYNDLKLDDFSVGVDSIDFKLKYLVQEKYDCDEFDEIFMYLELDEFNKYVETYNMGVDSNKFNI